MEHVGLAALPIRLAQHCSLSLNASAAAGQQWNILKDVGNIHVVVLAKWHTTDHRTVVFGQSLSSGFGVWQMVPGVSVVCKKDISRPCLLKKEETKAHVWPLKQQRRASFHLMLPYVVLRCAVHFTWSRASLRGIFLTLGQNNERQSRISSSVRYSVQTCVGLKSALAPLTIFQRLQQQRRVTRP